MVISPDLRRLLPTLNLKVYWGEVMANPWGTTQGIANLYRVLLGFDKARLDRPPAENWREWYGAHELGATLVMYRGRREEVQFCAEVLRPQEFYDTIVLPHRQHFAFVKQLKHWRDYLAKAESLHGPTID